MDDGHRAGGRHHRCRRLGDLAVGRRYAFRVAAVNEHGRGPWTEPVRETVVGVPSAPTGLRAEPEGPGRVALRVVRAGRPRRRAGVGLPGPAPHGTAGSGPRASDDDDETSRTVAGLPGATTQQFRVAALTEGGQGPWSEPASAVVPDSAPTAPRTPTATGDLGRHRDPHLDRTRAPRWSGRDRLRARARRRGRGAVGAGRRRGGRRAHPHPDRPGRGQHPPLPGRGGERDRPGAVEHGRERHGARAGRRPFRTSRSDRRGRVWGRRP